MSGPVPMRPRVVAAVLALVILAAAAGWWGVGVLRTRDLAAHVDRLLAAARRGDLDALLVLVGIARCPLVARGPGGTIATYDRGDIERLRPEAEDVLAWLPLERATLEREACARSGGDDGRCTVRLAFDDEGRHYEDAFDLRLRRTEGAWCVVEVALVGRAFPVR